MKSLDTLCELLPQDHPMEETEKLEAQYKQLLKYLAETDDGDLAYQAAAAQKRIGFILKYKSYGIKASTPLGFSIFFLEPEQGFSFQRHTDIKTEHFHFLAVPPGRNFAYLCESEEWEQHYTPETFEPWLAGASHAAFDQHCYLPKPGDIMSVERPGVVHTAIGCALEEYANVSTDMVDRLHDQNKGVAIPQKFNRQYFLKQLEMLQYPQESRRVVRTEKGFVAHPLPWTMVGEGKKLPIATSATYTAERLLLPPGASWIWKTEERFLSAFLSDGSVTCRLVRFRNKPFERVLPLDRHDVFLSLPHCEWSVQNTSPEPAQFSILSLEKKAFL